MDKNSDINIKIGMLLKNYRNNNGYSLSQVAEKIDRTKSCVYYWETGRNHIDVDMLDRLCHVYGTDMYSFFDELKELNI